MNPVHGRHLSLIDPSARAGPLSPFRTRRNLTSSDRCTRLLLEGGIDKSRAIHEEWRISEKMLFTMALVGGFWGVVLASELFHHKSSKLSFLVVVYGIMALWLFLLSRIGFLGCFLSSITPH